MKINIGSSVHELVLVPDFCTDDGGVVLGEYRPCEARVLVSKNYPAQVKRQTFWHEVVHGFLDEIGLEELMKDEGFVDALSKQIYSFFERNNIDKIYAFLGDNNGKANKTKNQTKS